MAAKFNHLKIIQHAIDQFYESIFPGERSGLVWGSKMCVSPEDDKILKPCLNTLITKLKSLYNDIRASSPVPMATEDESISVTDSPIDNDDKIEDSSQNKIKSINEIDESSATTCKTSVEKKNQFDSSEKRQMLDPNVVQIRASKTEIERRIAAFIEQKQSEVDDNNRREFCSHFLLDNEESCARTDAVFVPRAGCKSHVKVSRVVNIHGPQLRREHGASSGVEHSTSSQIRRESQDVPSGIDERLRNIESHLKLSRDLPRNDVYSRLKSLEERILFLESLSPEYFNSVPPSPKKKQIQKPKRNFMRDTLVSLDNDLSLQEIDKKIRCLQELLTARKIPD